MEEKKIDNEIIETKQKLTEVENQIDGTKDVLKRLDSMEEGFVALNKSINKCVELLSQSMKGNNVEKKLSDISDNNKIYLSNAVSSIDDERTNAKKSLEELYNAKDELEKKRKEQLKEVDTKDLSNANNGEKSEGEKQADNKIAE